MPKVKLIEVKGYTSQDEKYPAENLITGDKWLSSLTSKSTSIEATFQLAYTSAVTALDIGNCGSAFVSVLVSRTGCSEFKTLLPSSSFMTMRDSKDSHNRMGVRMFSKDNFAEDVRSEKWDQLRVVCSQPFNQHLQFGLSFIHVFEFHSTNDKPEVPDTKPVLSRPQGALLKNTLSPHMEEFELFYNKSTTDQNDIRKQWFLPRNNTDLTVDDNSIVKDIFGLHQKNRSSLTLSPQVKSRHDLHHNNGPLTNTNCTVKERLKLHSSSEPSTSQTTAVRKRLQICPRDGPSMGQNPEMKERLDLYLNGNPTANCSSGKKRREMHHNSDDSTNHSPSMRVSLDLHSDNYPSTSSSPAVRKTLDLYSNSSPSTSRGSEVRRDLHPNSGSPSTSYAVRKTLDLYSNNSPSTSRSPEVRVSRDLHPNSGSPSTSYAVRKTLDLYSNSSPSTSRSTEVRVRRDLHLNIGGPSTSSSSAVRKTPDLYSNNSPSTSRSTEVRVSRDLHLDSGPSTSSSPAVKERLDLYSNSSPSTSCSSEMRKCENFYNSGPSTSRDLPVNRTKEMQLDDTNDSNSAQEESDLFETIVISFMDSLHLPEKDLVNIKMMDLRVNLERRMEQILTNKQRAVFLKLVNKYLASLHPLNKPGTSKSTNLSPYVNGGITSPIRQIGSSIPKHTGERVQNAYKCSSASFHENGSELSQTSVGTKSETGTEDISQRLNVKNVCPRNQSNLFSNSYSKPGTSMTNDEGSSHVPTVFGGMKRKSAEDDNTKRKQHIIDTFVIDSDDSLDAMPQTKHNSRDKDVDNIKMECPLCYEFFDIEEIVSHSSQCSSDSSSARKEESIEQVMCPICKEMITKTSIDVHADICAEKMFGE